VTGCQQHRVDCLTVQQTASRLGSKLDRGGVRIHRCAMWTWFGERVIHVGSGKDPISLGERVCTQPVRIAGSVEALVMPCCDLADLLECADTSEHAIGEVRMQPNPFGLRQSQRTGLVPHRVRHAETTQIMDQAGTPDQPGVR